MFAILFFVGAGLCSYFECYIARAMYVCQNWFVRFVLLDFHFFALILNLCVMCS